MASTMDPRPCKRRRRDSSPPNDDDGDDELSFEPYEILAKRDAGYKLSLERAYADRRFQSTMTHIFEKYGRDFEGIGDEIDMATGDIVVDNGHLANMRNEGDVGVPDADHESISLDDFLVHDGWELPPANKEPQDDDDDDDDDDEDRILQGRSLNPPADSLVSTAKSPWLRQPQTSPCLSNDLFTGLGHPGFGSSPLAFGLSPFAMQPWSSPSLMPPTLHPRQLMSKTPSQLPPHRYDFPVQDGSSSIWAPNYRFKDNEPDVPPPLNLLGSLSAQPVTRLKSAKRLLPMPMLPPAKASDDDDVDEDAIINGTRQVASPLDNAHKHEDQLASCVTQLSEASPATSTKKTRPRRSLADPAVSVSRPSDKKPSSSDESQKDSALSKPDEKTLQSSSKEEKEHQPAPQKASTKRQRQRLVVQLWPLDTSRRRQFETVDLVQDEQEPAQGNALPNTELGGANSGETKSTTAAALSRVNGEPQTARPEECPPRAKATANMDDKTAPAARHEAPPSTATATKLNKKHQVVGPETPSSTATATKLYKTSQAPSVEAHPPKATPIKSSNQKSTAKKDGLPSSTSIPAKDVKTSQATPIKNSNKMPTATRDGLPSSTSIPAKNVKTSQATPIKSSNKMSTAKKDGLPSSASIPAKNVKTSQAPRVESPPSQATPTIVNKVSDEATRDKASLPATVPAQDNKGPQAPLSTAASTKLDKPQSAKRQAATPSTATSTKGNNNKPKAVRRQAATPFTVTPTQTHKTPLASRHEQAPFTAAPAQGDKAQKDAHYVARQPVMTSSVHELSDDEMPIVLNTKRSRSKKQKQKPTVDLTLVGTPDPALLSLPVESPPLETRQTGARVKSKAESLGSLTGPMSTEPSQWRQSQCTWSQWKQSQWKQSQWKQSQWKQSQWKQSQCTWSQWKQSQCT
ncbi:hypothetical protein CDD81_1904 [Ophiocordyceps australis]|uniref:Myb-like domain-containing protein n=1 Tax=Ophiocordyceps australis TaxID=1399860 RepID=A0A2C5XXX5_9HYPO|nr:hypothetical protein CDD81_1904 [Ophiocordyceps australis]